MKRFLIILSCVALLLPVAALLSFADNDPYTVVFRNNYSQNHGQNCILTFERRVYGSSDSYVSWQSVSVAESGTGSLTLDIGYDYRFYIRYGTSTVYPIPGVSVNGVVYSSDPFVWDDTSDTFDISCYSSSGSSPAYRYISIPSVDPLSPVNDGVDSSISYTGQLIHFLTTNSTTIVLIGLSVAMCAVLPFAIRKIKQIIKGY